MNWPSPSDFRDHFGLSPTEDDGQGFFRYVQTSDDNLLEITLTFDVVARSFQAVLRCKGREVAMICSELVSTMQLRCEKSESSVHVEFDIDGAWNHADIWFEPDVRMSCVTLQK